jgi:hypothetical protein
MSGAKSAVIYLTSDEYAELSEKFQESELAGTRDTYGSNHPFGEYIRQTIGLNPEPDVSDYGDSRQSVRYTEKVTVEFPPEQYDQLQDQFELTPIVDDVNSRYTLGGNSPLAEYLRRCLKQKLALAA